METFYLYSNIYHTISKQICWTKWKESKWQMLSCYYRTDVFDWLNSIVEYKKVFSS